MQGYSRSEGRASIEAAGDRQTPAMAGQDVLHNRQPEARSVLGAALASVDAVEPLGQAGQMFRGDAAPEVAHDERAFHGRAAHRHLDAIAAGTILPRAVLDRVLDQVLGDAQKL